MNTFQLHATTWISNTMLKTRHKEHVSHDSVYTAQSRQTNLWCQKSDRSYPGEGRGQWLRGNKGDFQGTGVVIWCWVYICVWKIQPAHLRNCTLLNMCIKIFLLEEYKSHPSCGGCNGQCGVWITEASAILRGGQSEVQATWCGWKKTT